MFKRDPSLIARRLTRMNMVTSGTALVLACVSLTALDFVTFRNTMVDNRSVQAQIVGANTVTALTFDDPETAERTLAALQAAPRIEGAGLYRPDGRLFASYRARYRAGAALASRCSGRPDRVACVRRVAATARDPSHRLWPDSRSASSTFDPICRRPAIA